mmetsp:Transcript_23318/g.62626  ORF Transcript_23318/g.62626 Transcript_23318/m.62626 type:complete len:236 (+) Transcript_23318:1439-2146(+)
MLWQHPPSETTMVVVVAAAVMAYSTSSLRAPPKAVHHAIHCKDQYTDSRPRGRPRTAATRRLRPRAHRRHRPRTAAMRRLRPQVHRRHHLRTCRRPMWALDRAVARTFHLPRTTSSPRTQAQAQAQAQVRRRLRTATHPARLHRRRRSRWDRHRPSSWRSRGFAQCVRTSSRARSRYSVRCARRPSRHRTGAGAWADLAVRRWVRIRSRSTTILQPLSTGLPTRPPTLARSSGTR